MNSERNSIEQPPKTFLHNLKKESNVRAQKKTAIKHVVSAIECSKLNI